ncbi:MAG: peptidyl-prolyl cis-trans isomerase [candidate division WOR-3 bacterium]
MNVASRIASSLRSWQRQVNERSLAMMRLVLALVLLFSCGGKRGQVVAVVNRVAITADELTKALPQTVDPGTESTVVSQTLEGLINRALFVQEAERLGLDSVIAYPLELEKKGLVIYELFADVERKTKPVSEEELQRVYDLLRYEVHCRVIAVRDKDSAEQLYQALENGADFITLAKAYSIHPSRGQGGDLGYIQEYFIEEPLRSAVLGLKPGEWTKPVFFDSSYQIVQLLDRRPVDPPPPPFNESRQQLEEQLKISRRRQAAIEYVQQLRRRLVYNPAGLRVFHKSVDSITEEEKEIWVAVRDSSKYVKVGRLLHIARTFPAGLDTAVRTYAIKRAIEDDLMYEDGLNRGLDRQPRVMEQLSRWRQKLLYESLYNRVITNKISITDEEVRQFYETHRERYPDNDWTAVAPLIRNNLFLEARERRFREFVQELRSRARIKINQQVIQSVIDRLKVKKER